MKTNVRPLIQGLAVMTVCLTLILLGVLIGQSRTTDPPIQRIVVPNRTAGPEVVTVSNETVDSPKSRDTIARAVVATPLGTLGGPILASTSAETKLTSQAEQPEAVELTDNDEVDEPLAPDDRPLKSGQIVTGTAFVGKPFGVGKFEIVFGQDDAPRWRPDRPIVLHETSRRTRFPVFLTVQKGGDEQESGGHLQQLSVYFLFQGDNPLQISVKTPDAELVKAESLTPAVDDPGRRQLLDEWWTHFKNDLASATGQQREFRSYCAHMLARRLQLMLPQSQPDTSDQPMAELERQFERIVSTLFGIDSVLLAMPSDVRVGEAEPADQRLPPAFAMRPVRLPSYPKSVAVETLALRVPQDCFYVRCKNLSNYLWLREFLLQWGGSLYEVIAANTTDSRARETIERQLAISAKRLQELGVDDAIEDMALVGSDLFFNDGAGVGVLFQATDTARLSEIIDNQRQASLRGAGDVQQRSVQIEGRSVPLLYAPGNTVRSYYVVDGEFHLVTNSRDIAAKFLRSGRAGYGLGHLNEFRYARTQDPLSRGGRIWIYLSDPFFRRLVSPSYRIEMARRARALAELQELRLAALVSASEGNRGATVEFLKEQGFLPVAFGSRCDESRPLLIEGSAVDSLRGSPGTFLPIPDMTIDKATRGEVVDYADFRRRYSRQWRAMDPVVASLASAGADRSDRERISVRILVTPYARERYRSLVSSLAPASSRRIARLRDDLLSLEAGLRSGTGTRQVHIGLQDAEVPFEIRNGEIIRHVPFEYSTFAGRSSYAVVNPPGSDGLQLIRRFQQSLEGDSLNTTQMSRSGSRLTNPPWNLGPVLGPLAMAIQFASSKTPKLLESMLVSSAIEHRGSWTVMARGATTRSRVLGRLGFETVSSPAQVRFRMRDVNAAEVAPYIRAFTFLKSRKSSAANTQLFDVLHQQLNVQPRTAISTAERVFRTRFVCPLGGMYSLATDAASPNWRSSAWSTESYYDLIQAPQDYRFPFLQWLRDLDVAFQLSRTTLSADIQLEVQRPLEATLVSARGDADGQPARRAAGEAIKRSSAPAKRPKPRILPVRDSRQLQPGDSVVTLDELAELKVGQTTLARLSRGENLTVLEIRGKWIGVQQTRDKKTLRGWVHLRLLGTVTERRDVAENDEASTAVHSKSSALQ